LPFCMANNTTVSKIRLTERKVSVIVLKNI
jgi:hypothetical protein